MGGDLKGWHIAAFIAAAAVYVFVFGGPCAGDGSWECEDVMRSSACHCVHE